jgi:hypothetical protein
MTRQIEVSEETYEKIKDQVETKSEFQIPETVVDMVEQKWFFRTVTYHSVGRVRRRMLGAGNSIILVLEDASWVADSGRFMGAIKDGSLSELEPVGDMLINLSAVVDAFPWRHPLPMEQK